MNYLADLNTENTRKLHVGNNKMQLSGASPAIKTVNFLVFFHQNPMPDRHHHDYMENKSNVACRPRPNLHDGVKVALLPHLIQ